MTVQRFKVNGHTAIRATFTVPNYLLDRSSTGRPARDTLPATGLRDAVDKLRRARERLDRHPAPASDSDSSALADALLAKLRSVNAKLA